MRQTARKYHRIAGLGAIVVCAAMGIVARSAHAASVYKCSGRDGAVAFQDRPCAKTQIESEVEMQPAPPPAPAVDYGRSSRVDRVAGAGTRVPASRQASAKKSGEVLSYECRAANGEVFYRHGACPKQIPAKAAASSGGSRRRAGAKAETYAVSAEPLSRGEVCRRMNRGGSIGRAGHERDETVSTYDRNLGRDPCRRF